MSPFVEPGSVLFIDSDGAGTLLVWQEGEQLRTELIDANRGSMFGPKEFTEWCLARGITKVQRIEFEVGEPLRMEYGGEYIGTTDLKTFVEWWEDLL